MQKLRKRFRAENGQALVELAFVIPIVLLFLFGIIDFGLALNQQNQNTNIANIGVREAAVYTTGSVVTCNGATKTTLSDWLSCMSTTEGGPTLTSVCVYDTASTPITNSFSSGDSVEVKVGSTFNWLHLIQSQVSSLQSSIGANATMRLEQSGWTTPTTPAFLVNPSSCPTNPSS